ncbi:MAG: glycerol-3-phosphate acyltransferase PlsX [Kiritimatiellia bacterium]|jgi:glycerol-3-phosphate acyltransferase PlsX
MSDVNTQTLPVAVDVMGTDHGPQAVVEGAILASNAGVPVCLVGDESVAALAKNAGLSFVLAPEFVGMHESPLLAVRAKKRSSIRVALELLSAGAASSFVSFGNTGAVVVESVRTLRLVAGVERPAIAVLLPRLDGGQLVMVDVGANVDCRAEHLVSFADLGCAWARLIGASLPRVGLLSNGEEPSKGNQVVRAAAELLGQREGWVGQIEPAAALAGGCDVLVADGFVGNVMIKGMEAAAAAVRHLLHRRGVFETSLSSVGRPASWETYGGGLLLGVDGVTVIGHGRVDPSAAAAAIRLAWTAAGAGLVSALTPTVDAPES